MIYLQNDRIYPATSLECGSGGTGTTIDLELNENLSHVDGAIGMARSVDPNSADSQWYIAETEAHGLILKIGMMKAMQHLALLGME